VEFDDEAFRLDEVGLSMFLPLGTSAESGRVGNRTKVTIKSKDNNWLVNILTPQTSNASLTTAQALDELISQVMRDAGKVYDKDKLDKKEEVVVGLAGQIIEPRHTCIIGERAAERAYIRVPGQREGIDPNFIRGYTVFKLSDTQFVTFELITTEPVFNSTRYTYEAMLAAATFEDPSVAASGRASAIKAGLKALERVDERTMREIIEANPERWERMFKPAPTGDRSDDTEVGYRRIQMKIGTRADLGSAKAGVDRRPGYIVRLDARYLDPKKTGESAGQVVDVQAVYFQTFDRESEAWSVRNAIRQGKETSVFGELGAREGNAMSVELTPHAQPPRSVRPIIQSNGEGYISRVESLLLPQILIRSGLTADFGFYAYQSDREAIRLRRDELEQPIETPGLWRLTSRLGEDRLPQVSTYTDKGELIRSEMPRGVVAEPITFDELVRLWKQKSLPLK